MQKIICIYDNGFRKIMLPDGYVINIITCDNGCHLTTENMTTDIDKINKYIGLSIYQVFLDDCSVDKGYKLDECKLIPHPDCKYTCIHWREKLNIINNIKE